MFMLDVNVRLYSDPYPYCLKPFLYKNEKQSGFLQDKSGLTDHIIAFIANGISRKPKLWLNFSMAIGLETNPK